MIYLQEEIKQFSRTKKKFADLYEYLLEQMFKTFKEKGAVRDAVTPIHYRLSPRDMLALIKAKSRRIEALMSSADYARNSKRLASTVEECIDVANYSLYIATICELLLAEESE